MEKRSSHLDALFWSMVDYMLFLAKDQHYMDLVILAVSLPIALGAANMS